MSRKDEDVEFTLRYIRGQASVEEYVKRKLSFDSFKERCEGCEGMAEKCYEAYADALFAMDLLPRTDPFWQGSNNRPTLGKVSSWARLRLVENPEDIVAAWVLIDLTHSGVLNHYEVESWRLLLKKREMNVRWIVSTAWNQFPLRFDGAAGALVDLLKKLGLAKEAMPTLEMIKEHHEDFVREWSDTETARNWATYVMDAL